jgi:hypothetical protein
MTIEVFASMILSQNTLLVPADAKNEFGLLSDFEHGFKILVQDTRISLNPTLVST